MIIDTVICRNSGNVRQWDHAKGLYLRHAKVVAALLAPRPGGLLVLNEPETSLHPELLAPLARLISAASSRSQVIAVSHAQVLVNALHQAAEDAANSASTIELVKDFGETRVAGREPLDGPAWRWPERTRTAVRRDRAR